MNLGKNILRYNKKYEKRWSGNLKIYISADIEGVSGVVNKDHISPDGYDYQRARMLMTKEVNAAVEGAIEAGAKEIIVNDSHGPMTNIIIEALNSKANLITGTPKKLGMMEGIDDSYDAVIMIGYHSKMNSAGVLAHSYHGGVVSDISINGKSAGEFFINASIAGYFDVPVILVSGDNILSDEVSEINNKIENIVVKTAQGRYAAKCISPEIVHEMIREKVEMALLKIDNIPSTTESGPIELKVSFLNSGLAEVASIMPRTELIAPNVVLYNADNIIESYRAMMAMIQIASSII